VLANHFAIALSHCVGAMKFQATTLLKIRLPKKDLHFKINVGLSNL